MLLRTPRIFYLYVCWISLLREIAVKADSFSFVSNHQNTQAGADTTIPDIVYFPTLYQDTVGSCYIYQLWNQSQTNGPAFFLYSPTATASGRSMGVLLGQEMVFVRRPLLQFRSKLYAWGSGDFYGIHDQNIAYDSTTNYYTTINWAFNENVMRVLKAIPDTAPSNFLYYLQGIEPTDNTAYIRKWDKTKATPETVKIFTTHYLCHAMRFLQGFLWVHGLYDTPMQFVDVAAMTIVKSLSGPTKTRDALFHESTIEFKSFSPYGIQRVVMGAASYTITHSVPPVSSDAEWSDLINLGTTGYVGLVRFWEIPNRPFRIYSKQDLSEISTLLYIPMAFPNYIDDTLTPGLTLGRPKTEIGFGISVKVGGVQNFQSWKSVVDTCLNRVGIGCWSCPPNTYIDRPGMSDNSCVPISQGLDPTTGLLAPCLDTNCQECGIDNAVCVKCLPASASPYLFNSRCVGLPEIPDRFGVDQNSMTVVACQDPNCLNCRPDFRSCLACDGLQGYQLSSAACIYDAISKLGVASAIYDPTQLIASVTFDADIQIEGQPEDLNFSVLDTQINKVYTCQELKCNKQFQNRGVSLQFEEVPSIFQGQIALDSTSLVRVFRANDSRLFVDYPVSIMAPVFSLDRANRTSTQLPVDITVQIVQSMQVPSTLFFAAMYPSLTPLFDEIFAEISVLAFYQSPPMFLLDQAILSFKNVTILPFHIPNLFSVTLDKEKCSPQEMLLRYQYQCKFLANFGVDLTILTAMLAYVLGVKGCLHWLTKVSKLSQRSIPGAVPKFSNQPEHPITAPIGERLAQPKVSRSVVVLKWLDQHFGFLLLVSKLEAKQGEYLVFALQDIWSSGTSFSRIINTSVSVSVLAYPIFCLNAIRRLVGFICAEFRIPRWLNPQNRIWSLIRIRTINREIPNSTNAPGKETVTDHQQEIQFGYSLSPRQQLLDLECNPKLAERWFYPWRFWFDQAHIPISDLRFMLPMVTFLRHIIKGLLIVGSSSVSRKQCMVGLVLELFYFLFVWNYSLKSRWLEIVAERALLATSAAFMIGKYFSHSVDERFLQTDLASWMLVLILIKMLIAALVSMIAFASWLRSAYKTKKSNSKGGPDQSIQATLQTVPVAAATNRNEPPEMRSEPIESNRDLNTEQPSTKTLCLKSSKSPELMDTRTPNPKLTKPATILAKPPTVVTKLLKLRTKVGRF